MTVVRTVLKFGSEIQLNVQIIILQCWCNWTQPKQTT